MDAAERPDPDLALCEKTGTAGMAPAVPWKPGYLPLTVISVNQFEGQAPDRSGGVKALRR